MHKNFKLSVVVPCFNEARVLSVFHTRMRAACEAIAGHSYEIVYIDDGSTDGTMELIVSLNQVNPCVVGLELFRNHGHQIAASAGLQISRGERVLLIDADLQDPPELLGAFWAKMDEGYDVVYGQRIKREGETWFKRATASFFYRVLRQLSDTTIPLDAGDFRLMTREVVEYLNSMPERHRFLRGMVAWVGGRQIGIPYERAARYAGKTKYSFSAMLKLAWDAVTGFSVAPLKLATYLSFAAVVGALFLLVYVLISYLFFVPAPGWTSLGVIVLAASAAQMFAIGMVGEYLGRLYLQALGRPTTLIRNIVGSQNHVRQQEIPCEKIPYEQPRLSQ